MCGVKAKTLKRGKLKVEITAWRWRAFCISAFCFPDFRFS
jgi:hypothetical protein